MMKNVQQMRTMLPIGRRDDSSVCTTSFRPGARLITLHTSSDTQCTVKLCLQCYDAVGWAAGRASGLQKLSGGGLCNERKVTGRGVGSGCGVARRRR